MEKHTRKPLLRRNLRALTTGVLPLDLNKMCKFKQSCNGLVKCTVPLVVTVDMSWDRVVK